MSQVVDGRRKHRTSAVCSRRNAGQAEIPGKTKIKTKTKTKIKSEFIFLGKQFSV
jgi:hypothetical protein